jgi:hypothetical protein
LCAGHVIAAGGVSPLYALWWEVDPKWQERHREVMFGGSL